MPRPDGLLWHDPGFPSVVVTYGASRDFFFSGHMALSTLFAMELSIQGTARRKQIVAWGAIGLHVFVILSMRFHYVQDVVAGFLAAIVVALVAGAMGPRLDQGAGAMVRTGDAGRRSYRSPWGDTARRLLTHSGW